MSAKKLILLTALIFFGCGVPTLIEAELRRSSSDSEVSESEVDQGASLIGKRASKLLGDVRGLDEKGGKYYLTGWACNRGVEEPVKIELLASSMSISRASLFSVAKANQEAGNARIRAQCEWSGRPIVKFRIHLEDRHIRKYAGFKLFVRISSSKGSKKRVLPNSGLHAMPFKVASDIASRTMISDTLRRDLAAPKFYSQEGVFDYEKQGLGYRFKALCLRSGTKWRRVGSPPICELKSDGRPEKSERAKLRSAPRNRSLVLIRNLGINQDEFSEYKGFYRPDPSLGVPRFNQAMTVHILKGLVSWSFKSSHLDSSLKKSIAGSGIHIHHSRYLSHDKAPRLGFEKPNNALLFTLKTKVSHYRGTAFGGFTLAMNIVEKKVGEKPRVVELVTELFRNGITDEAPATSYIGSDTRRAFGSTSLALGSKYLTPVASRVQGKPWNHRKLFQFRFTRKNLSSFISDYNQRVKDPTRQLTTNLSRYYFGGHSVRSEFRYLSRRAVELDATIFQNQVERITLNNW